MVSSENIPISRRGRLAARTKQVFFCFTYKLKNFFKNHEINENKMLKRQHFHKNNFYKMAIFNCFKNKKLKLTF